MKRPKSAAVQWLLRAFHGRDGSLNDRLADVSFLRQDVIGLLFVIGFRFKKETVFFMSDEPV